MRVYLVNSENYERDARLYLVTLGVFGTPMAVWARPYEGMEFAVEEAAHSAAEEGYEAYFTQIGERELREAREDLARMGNSDPEEYEIQDYAAADLYYTESGYIGPDWGIDEYWRGDPVYEQVLLASAIDGPSRMIEIDRQHAPDPTFWTRDLAWVREVVGRLAAVCGGLITPVAQYPQFLSNATTLGDFGGGEASSVPTWVLNLSCWPGIEEEVEEAIKLIISDLRLVGAEIEFPLPGAGQDEVAFILGQDESGRPEFQEVDYLHRFTPSAFVVRWERWRRRLTDGGIIVRVLDGRIDVEEL